MYNKLVLFFRLLRHYFYSQSRFDLHSPFVFSFYKDVLKNNSNFPDYMRIEHIRKNMLGHPGFIRMTDLGSKSSDIKWDRRIIRTRKVAAYSTVSPVFGHFLFRVARFFKPETILELGTSLGISASYMALGNPDGKVITVEGCRETAEFARTNFEHLGLLNIEQIIGDFDDVLPGILSEKGKIKMFFIDGNHRKDPTMKYFFQILDHIDDDSVLILDDIHWSKGMEEAWKMICDHDSVKVTIDLFRMGVVFFSERLSKEDFIIRL
jgi:predicted O-methyltransferase YrrM